MSSCTDLFCRIHFPYHVFQNIEEVENELDICRSVIKSKKEELRDLIFITEPEKYYDKEEYSSAKEWLDAEIRECFEALDEEYEEMFRYQYLIDNWNKCHDVKNEPIGLPNNIDYDDAFIF